MYVTGVRYGIPNKDLVFIFDISEKGGSYYAKNSIRLSFFCPSVNFLCLFSLTPKTKLKN